MSTVKYASELVLLSCIYCLAYRGGFGVFKPPPEILKILVETSIA